MNIARSLATEAWKTAIEDQDDVDLVAIAKQINAELCANPEFVNSYMSTSEQFIYDVGARFLASKRSMVRQGQRVMTPTVLREKLATEAGRSSWDDWQERDTKAASTGIYKKLLDMSKEQLIAGAEGREVSTRTELIDAAMMRLMAGRLKEGQVAREVWTPDSLTDLRNRIRVDVTLGVEGVSKEVTKTITAAGAALPSLAAD